MWLLARARDLADGVCAESETFLLPLGRVTSPWARD